MNVYYDSGVLLPLYVKEAFSDVMLSILERRKRPISFNLLQQMEMDTAIRLKMFRGEIDGSTVLGVIAARDEDVRIGRLAVCPVNWILAIEEARRFGRDASTHWGCRTLDLLHIAIAVQWQCAEFVTADDRQVKAARSAGLKTVDVRDLVRPRHSDGAESGDTSGAVREKRTRYAARTKRVSHSKSGTGPM